MYDLDKMDKMLLWNAENILFGYIDVGDGCVGDKIWMFVTIHITNIES